MTRIHREKVRAVAPELTTVPFFCVSKSSMYNFTTESTNSDGVFFQEREFIAKLSDIEARGRQMRSIPQDMKEKFRKALALHGITAVS